MNGHDKGDRYRIFRVSERLILTVLGQWRRYDHIALPDPLNLPDDWEIHGVSYEMSHRGFGILVWSQSFEVVPPGGVISYDSHPLQFLEHAILIGDMRPSTEFANRSRDLPAVAAAEQRYAEGRGSWTQILESTVIALAEKGGAA